MDSLSPLQKYDDILNMTIPDSDAKLRPITAKIVIKTVVFVFLTAVLLIIWQSSIVRLSKNFHEVDPGRFYRSAQLTPAELEEVIEKYKIKTVISLRGAADGSYWVAEQRQVLDRLKVPFYSFSWSLDYFPKASELRGYLQALKTAEFPVLVHCRAGADRTGEATALYAIDFLKMPKEEAIKKYLSFKYWHIKAFHPTMTEFIRLYPGLEQAIASYDECAPENKKFSRPGDCS